MNPILAAISMFAVTLPLLLSIKIWVATEDQKALLTQALRLVCGLVILSLFAGGSIIFFESINGKFNSFHVFVVVVAFFVLSSESSIMSVIAFGVLLLFSSISTAQDLDVLGTIGVFFGFGAAAFAYNKIDTPFLEFIDKHFNIQNDKEGLTDIRDLSLKEIAPYMLDEHVQPDSIFLGMSENNEPVSIDYETFGETNFQIIGYPGAGKGVFAQMVLSQIKNRIVVFDPKNDKYLTSMFANEESSQFIWLNDDTPQIDLFKGATELEITNGLIEALSMKEKGTDADVYTLEEQEIIRTVVSEGSRSFESWLKLAESEHSRSRKVIARFQALNRYSCIRGVESLLEKLEKGNVYIIFDESDETQKIIARLIFARLCQIKRNGQFEDQLTLFCDEFIHLVNKSSVNALGLLRSHLMNFIIAHQSLGDFEANFPDVESKEARQRTLDNTQVKVVYKQLTDAQYWSEMTGSKLYDEVTKEQSIIGINQKFGSSIGRTRTQEKPLIDINEFQSLQKRVAILIGHGLPTKILTTTPTFDTSIKAPRPFKKPTADALEIVDLDI